MKSSRRILGAGGVMAMLCLFLATPAPAASKVFGGKVLRINPKAKSFTLNVPASRKYPQVTVTVDGKTTWSGIVSRFQALKVGQVLTVNCTPVKDTTFKAVSVNVPDPNMKPSAGGSSPGG